MSPRRLSVLVRNLPPGCALDVAQRGAAARWGPAEHLQALAVDALHAANWQRGGDQYAARPKPVPRPAVIERRHSPQRERALAAARERAHERRRRIEAGEIT